MCSISKESDQLLSRHLIMLPVQAQRQILWGPVGDSVVTAWPQDCFTPLSLLHKHSEWPSTLCADVEVKPESRKEGRKKGRVLDWEDSCMAERQGGDGGALSNSSIWIFKSLWKQTLNKSFRQLSEEYSIYDVQNLTVGGWRRERGTLESGFSLCRPLTEIHSHVVAWELRIESTNVHMYWLLPQIFISQEII